MKTLTEALQRLENHLADATASAFAAEAVVLAEDDEIIALLQAAGRVRRLLDGCIVEATAQVLDRDTRERDARLTTQSGCRDAVELLQRTLLVDRPAARRCVAAARSIHRQVDLTSGALLPGRYERLHEALRDGVVSIAGFLACTAPLESAHGRIGDAARADADRVLARVAAGFEPDGTTDAAATADGDDRADGDDTADGGDEPGPPPTPDELSLLARRIVAHLDPDGSEPADVVAQRKRFFTLGLVRDGLVPVRGALLPEVAGQLQRLFSSVLNPKAPSGEGTTPEGTPRDGTTSDETTPDETTPDGTANRGARSADRATSAGQVVRFVAAPAADDASADDRTPAQRRHDALATVLTAAAASGGMPALGGAAPTLVVSVSAEDYARGSGRASIESSGYDVPISVARHAACAGGIQRVLFDERGAIVGIGSSARLFNAAQRRAIQVRDRECLIPGCHVPADWCEIHHVTEWQRGGPTHTHNGVALCWHHHRTLGSSGWEIRMRDGCPEIRGPAWWDPSYRWRRPRVWHVPVRERAPALSAG